MDYNGPEAWYANLPRVTRFVITFTFLLTLATTFNLVSPMSLILNWEFVFQKYQFHRVILSCIYAGPFSLKWVFHIYMFSQFSSMLEKNVVFANSVGSYLYFILIQMLLTNAVSSLFYWPIGYPVLSDALLFAILYYWSKRDMWNPVTIYIFTVKAYQLPFAMLFFNFIMGAPVLVHLIGLISGHAYYLFKEVLPSKGYPNIFGTTPRWIDYLAKKMEELLSFPSLSMSSSVTGSYTYVPSSRRPQATTGFIGRGIRLGG